MSDRCHVVAAALLLLLSAPPVFPQTPAPVLTLNQAIAEAQHNSRRVKQAALDVARAEDDLTAVRTRRLPNFEVRTLDGTLVAPLGFLFDAGTFGVFPQIGPVPPTDTTIKAEPRLNAILFARVAEPLTDLRKVSLETKVLGVGRDLTREKVREEEQMAANTVTRLYYAIARAQTGLEASGSSLTLDRELDRVMTAYLERQAVLPADSLSVKTALAREEQRALTLRDTIATLEEQLNLTMGRDLDTTFTIEPVPDAADADVDLAAAQSRALEQRPEVREARFKAEQAALDLQLAKQDRVPEISVAFNYLGLYNFAIVPTHAAIIGVVGEWEPWDWGRRRAVAAGKQQRVSEADLAVKEAEEMVRADVRSCARKLQEARALQRVAALGQQTAREKLRVALEQFKQQANLDRQVLEAQTASVEADQQHQDALEAYWTARADLQKAIGQP